MNTEYSIIISILNIMVIFYIIYFGYSKFFIDKYRHNIITLRDHMFDEMIKQGINFDNEAYVLLRTTMNGFIRFGHRLSMWRLIYAFMILKKKSTDKASFSAKWKNAIEKMPTEQQDFFNRHKFTMEIYTFQYLLLASPELWPFMLLASMWLLIKAVQKSALLVLKDKYMGLEKVSNMISVSYYENFAYSTENKSEIHLTI